MISKKSGNVFRFQAIGHLAPLLGRNKGAGSRARTEQGNGFNGHRHLGHVRSGPDSHSIEGLLGHRAQPGGVALTFSILK